MKLLGYIVWFILFALVTFFGVGPVLFADGPPQERLVTSVIVILIYVLLVMFWRWLRRRS